MKKTISFKLRLLTFVFVCIFALVGQFGTNASKRSFNKSERVVTPQFTANIIASARRTNSLVYHAPSGKIYASVPSAADPGGNSIAKIDPTTGNIEESVWVGSEPDKLALANDGNSLYVVLDGARAVRKFDISSGTADQQFWAGYVDPAGPLVPLDIAVSPNNPDLVALSRVQAATCSSNGLAIFDNGVPRPHTGGEPYAITFGADENTLFANSSYGELQKITIDNSGVASVSTLQDSNGDKVRFIEGRLYTSVGNVLDPANGDRIGTFTSPEMVGSLPFAVDIDSRKAFYVGHGFQSLVIDAFDIDTFALVGSISFSLSEEPIDLVRWGTNGLALSTENQTYFIQSDLVGPGTIMSPTPWPGLPPYPTFVSFTRRIDLPNNDILYNQSDGSLYASVPSLAGSGLGNSIAKINPNEGNVTSSTFVGSEPGKIAVSNDGSTIYALLNGSNAIRRFSTGDQTAGQQFSVPPDISSFSDLLVIPGSNDSVAVTLGSYGFKIYDNGTERPILPNSITAGWIEHNGTSNTIYNLDGWSSSHLSKLTVNAEGATVATTWVSAISGADIRYDSGRLYSNRGSVIDPELGRILGQFNVPGADFGGTSIAVDSNLRKAFILTHGEIAAFDTDTFNLVGTILIPSIDVYTTPSNLVRWGTNGLAFRVQNQSGESWLELIQSNLISSEGAVPSAYSLASGWETTTEGSMAAMNVYRSGNTAVTSSVAFSTVDGSAKAGTDYRSVSGTLTFAPGEISKTVLIPVLNDDIYEGYEYFSFVLTGSQLLSPTSCTFEIRDSSPQPSITAQGSSVTEPSPGNSITLNIQVGLSNASAQTVTVDFSTANGSAIAGVDYLAASGTLTFAPMETSKTISVQVLGDSVNEQDENFFLILSNPTNASGVTGSPATVTIRNFHFTAPAFIDFDGDSKSDIGITRPNNGVTEWWISRSSDSNVFATVFGVTGDIPAPGDFTGDGKTDIAMFRPSNGNWFVLRSEDFTFFAFPFGANGDIPMPADFDGDGKADTAVYRPSTFTWFIPLSGGGGTTIAQFGAAGDQPVAADYDGDGKADIAIYRQNNGAEEWWIQRSSAGLFATVFGAAGDKAVPGDYTGDGKADVAVWRPSNGNWFILRSEDLSFFAFPWGANGDIPAPGDYDGDGKTDAAVFRQSSATWFINRTGGSGPLITGFGAATDSPVAGAFVR